ncbi:hypothetical protein P3T76_000539 [Phytophthora citrophthora]|uniref:PX domain-containing protein n=1 Tax=Phytophthora citrophthora TaxID=4793 RepID=A0AAD9LVI7_9STRA|nr:hypothetical protein P3T76_000539 [Phytophthora citrophthora]
MRSTSFPIAGANQQKPGQRSSEPRKHSSPVALEEESKPPAEFQSSCCCDHRAGANVQAHLEALNVQLRSITKTLETVMQSTTDTMKPRARTVSSDNAKPTIVLNLPGVRLAVLTSAYDSLLHCDVTLSSVVSLLLAAYIACVLAWNILAFVLGLLAHAAAFAFVTFHTFMGLSMLSTNTTTSIQSYSPKLETKAPATATPTLPLLCVGDAVIPSKSTHADGTTASKRKELQAPAARRRVLAHLNRNRLLINVVPGDMRRRVDMNLSEANIRVGKAFLQNVPGKRKPRDIYVVRIDCGAQSATQEKHMNPVIMWDVTASFEEFKRLEHDLKKEIKAKKQSRGVKVPHLSSGAVLFVQPELTSDVLNARRVRLQTFIDTVRSDPVLSTMGCLRKFCQAY